MEIRTILDINLRDTFLNSVGENDEFHFFADELTSDNLMPTYIGEADEIYTYDELNDEFFDFLERKRNQNGIYIRLVNVIRKASEGGKLHLDVEYAGFKSEFTTEESNFRKEKFTDYGIKVKGNEVSFGTTVHRGDLIAPYFAEFGSSGKILSCKNPVNIYLYNLMREMII